MMEVPFDRRIVDDVLQRMGIANIGDATIRQSVAVSEEIERLTGTKFVHFEMGSPGLPACAEGVAAQKEALDRGVACVYPNMSGITPLKEQASRFIQAFLNVEVNAEGCIPSVGSMMGTFATFILCAHLDRRKDTILYIAPGFPVQPLQAKVLGYKTEQFDIYHYRDEKLRDKLESYLSKGNVAAVVYSNPNNPTWVCLTEKELQIIGELMTRYDAIAVEDLAYLGMDFRKDLGKPFEPPYQATVARYTDNYILMLSASKIFSYAGERIAIVAISDALFNRHYDYLQEEYGMGTLGKAFVFTILYTLSSGVSQSAQYALAAMYRAACDGRLDFVAQTREYARRAERIKAIFCRNHFHIVYDKDLDQPVSDGFFFTIGRRGFTGDRLLHEFLHYGISAISLRPTGSEQEGIRVCTSKVAPDTYDILDERLRIFDRNNPIT